MGCLLFKTKERRQIAVVPVQFTSVRDIKSELFRLLMGFAIICPYNAAHCDHSMDYWLLISPCLPSQPCQLDMIAKDCIARL